MAGDAKSVNWRNSMRFMLNRRNRGPFNVMGIVMPIASANLRPRKRLSPGHESKAPRFHFYELCRHRRGRDVHQCGRELDRAAGRLQRRDDPLKLRGRPRR
jgi:hypothetical protein